METTGNSGDGVLRERRVAIQVETEEHSTKQEQTVKADSVLKSLSPLIISMRVFGLYFNRKPSVGSDAVSDLNRRCTPSCKCQTWNTGRVYATIMLVMTWLNAARCCVVFNNNETLGIDLLLKLGILTSALLQIVLRSTYYIASHTGSLDRVFCEADLCTADFVPKYRRRAKIVTILCWTFITSNIVYYINMICNFASAQLKDPTLVFIIENFDISKPYADILKAVFIVLEIESWASWSFTQAMK